MRFYTNVQCVGNKIFLREYDNGKRREVKLDYSPTLFVSGRGGNSNYKTLHGESVEPIKHGSIRDAREFIKKYDDIENLKIYGHTQFIYPFIGDEYPSEIQYDESKINICNIDIEVECENGFPEPTLANEIVNAITMKMKDQYIVLGLGDWENKNPETKHLKIKYYKFTDELSLLRSFLEIWSHAKIDIVTGWNVNQFDMTYLVNRIGKTLGDDHVKRLSSWGIVKKIEKNIRGQMQTQVQISGLSIIDYLDLYKKFTYVTRETYRLDHIAYVELGRKKLDHSEFANMHLFYKQDYQKFIDYNIIDVELVDKLEDKLKLMELLITIAYQSKVNYDEVFSPIKVWDSIAFHELRRSKTVIPPRNNNTKSEAYEGAYVKDPTVGKHEWVMSFDLNSLYPHLIMQYNISPETLYDKERVNTSVEKLLNQETDLTMLQRSNMTVCPSGVLFNKDKRGFLPKLMQSMYDDRTTYKKLMLKTKQDKIDGKGDPIELDKKIAQLNNKQMAAKILLNSAYGALGNQYFRYFDIRQAESITLSGQLSIRWIEEKVNNYMNKILKNDEDKNYVIASDTDSIYVALGDLVDKFVKIKEGESKSEETRRKVDFLDKVAQEKFEPYIDKCYQDLATYVNAYDQKMQMAREVIADSGIWTAKKRYILNVWDNEGVRYKSPELKIMGLEAVRSSTPESCRNMIKKSLELILRSNNDSLIEFIEQFRQDFKTYEVDDVAFPRSVNGLTKYHDPAHTYKKGTPIHVKGVLFYNQLVRKHKLELQYPPIKDGEKIKFCYLKEPNPLQNNTIAIAAGTLPKEFELDKFLDYDTQFEKAYLEPIKTITETIGWEIEKKITLDSFFN